MSSLGNFVWSIADQLRGVYKPHQYGDVILPITILRRLDCILEPDPRRGPRRWLRSTTTGAAATSRSKRRPGSAFYNTSSYDFASLLADPDGLRGQPDRLHRPVLRRTSTCSSGSSSRTRSPPWTRRTGSTWSSRSSPRSTCTPTRCPNAEMGDLFEELIRKFAEASNETAGEHYTPRDAIRLHGRPALRREQRRPDRAGHRPLDLRPDRRHRRHARRSPRSTCSEQQPRRAAAPVRPGDQRPVLRDLQVRHDRQGPGRRPTSASATRSPTTCSRDTTFDFCMSNPPYGVDWKAVARGRSRPSATQAGAVRPVRPPGCPSISRRADAVPAPTWPTRCGPRTTAAAGPGSS